MTHIAQSGTVVLGLTLVLALLGCESEHHSAAPGTDPNGRLDTSTASAVDARVVVADASSTAGDAQVLPDAAQSDAAASGTCQLHTDCTLVARGCCASCSPTKASYVAVPAAQSGAASRAQCPAGPVSCEPCPPAADDPLAPRLKAACVAQRCEVVDVRDQELSRCSADADCELSGAGCCPPCGDDPRAYLSLHRDADDAILSCLPTPPCKPCGGDLRAIAFCAKDGHCAVRRVENVSGTASTTCFSPTQNLDSAYVAGATGCDCSQGTFGVCRADSTGRRVALVCTDQHWAAVEDGPCSAAP